MLSSKILFFIQLNQWAYMVLLEDVVDREIYFLEGKFLFPSFRRCFVNGFFLYVLTGNWSSIYNPSIVSLQECITQTSMRMCGYGWERDGILQNSLCLLVLVTFLKFMYMCVEVIVTNWWFVFKTLNSIFCCINWYFIFESNMFLLLQRCCISFMGPSNCHRWESEYQVTRSKHVKLLVPCSFTPCLTTTSANLCICSSRNPTMLGCIAGSTLMRKAASLAFENKKRSTLTTDIIECLGRR